MSGNIIHTDDAAAFAAQSREQQVESLYLLLEQLRYVLQNLGAENFSDAGLEELRRALGHGAFSCEKKEGRTNVSVTADVISLSGKVYINGRLLD